MANKAIIIQYIKTQGHSRYSMFIKEAENTATKATAFDSRRTRNKQWPTQENLFFFRTNRSENDFFFNSKKVQRHIFWSSVSWGGGRGCRGLKSLGGGRKWQREWTGVCPVVASRHSHYTGRRLPESGGWSGRPQTERRAFFLAGTGGKCP